MLADIYTAILLGFSFSNIWICALVIFSLQTSNKFTGIGYIAGRFLGIIAFVLLFHIIGTEIKLSGFLIDTISGISILIFGVYFIYKYSRYEKRQSSDSSHTKHQMAAESCEHDCDSCIIRRDPDMYKYCESCTDNKDSCSSENPMIEPLTRNARRIWGKSSLQNIKKEGLLFGIFLGLIRGSAMCGRLVILLPLAIKGTIMNSLAIGMAFALSSTLYPVLIMLFSDLVLRAVRYRNIVVIVNSIFLIFLSIYYIQHAFSQL